MAEPSTSPASPHGPAPWGGHTPVLPAEVLDCLAPAQGETFLDCTAGRGGHAALVAERLGASGRIILNDQDAGNLAASAARIRTLAAAPAVTELHGNFADAPRRLTEQGLGADAVLADLGFASNQMDDAARGFSFMRDGPLDMRLDPGSTRPTAAQLVNSLPETELGEIIRDWGEDRAWKQIAAKLVAVRKTSPIDSTSALAAAVKSCFPPHVAHGPIHPATRTFQALRIAVNDELGSLRSLLESVSRSASRMKPGATPGPAQWLKPGARIAVISFHSLEDRLVKQAFAELADRGLARLLTKRPIECTDAERASNPRSRSAKLRAIQIQ